MTRKTFGMRRPRRRYGRAVFVLALCAALIAALYIPLPYYVFAPGSADRLQSMVRVEGGHRNEKGAFMMTTVEDIYANNVFMFLYGILQPHHQILTASEVSGGLSDTAYYDIEAYMMRSSHQDAIYAALHYLGLPVKLRTEGVEVLSVERSSPARAVLRPGDVITSIDGTSVAANPNNLVRVLHKQRVGGRVRLTVMRGGKRAAATVPVINLNAGRRGKPVPGIGVYPAVAQTVSTPVRVRINSGGIDGPSAGLMFTLEIINQLYKGGDLTKGYQIAGTGTIDAQGRVGQIGGIRQKVVAADRAGAEYFLAPADVAKGDTNAAHAEAEARALGARMKIVPVATLAQAVSFLKSLPPRR